MSEQPQKVIRFLFDYVSPYAYLAWMTLPELLTRYELSVEPVPVLFAGLLNAHGNFGPAEIPAKRRYMIDDVLQTAHMLDVPIRPPSCHPFNPLLALRVTACRNGESGQDAIIDACFRSAWRDALDLSEPAALRAILDDLDMDGAALLEQAALPAAKDQLRCNTDNAIAAGVFGVPTFVLEGQLFWGVDSLSKIEAKLRGEDILDRELSTYWKQHVRSSAKRRGGR